MQQQGQKNHQKQKTEEQNIAIQPFDYKAQTQSLQNLDSEMYYYLFQKMLQEKNFQIEQINKSVQSDLLEITPQKRKFFSINNLEIYSPNNIPFKILLTTVPKLSNFTQVNSVNFDEDSQIVLKNVCVWNVRKINCGIKLAKLVEKPHIKFFNLFQLIKFNELKELNLQLNNITSIETLQNFYMPKIQCLLLHSNQITNSKVFKKLSFQNDAFFDLYINGNKITQLNHFSRIKAKRLRTIRLQFPPPFYVRANRPDRKQPVQSQGLQFSVKLQPKLGFLRIHHTQRLIQEKIQHQIKKNNWDIYIGRST